MPDFNWLYGIIVFAGSTLGSGIGAGVATFFKARRDPPLDLTDRSEVYGIGFAAGFKDAMNNLVIKAREGR